MVIDDQGENLKIFSRLFSVHVVVIANTTKSCHVLHLDFAIEKHDSGGTNRKVTALFSCSRAKRSRPMQSPSQIAATIFGRFSPKNLVY